MTIQLFSDKLRETLEERIDKLNPDRDSLVTGGQVLTLIRETIYELKEFTLKYKFRNEREEIIFFKEIKPLFISLYIYHRKLFALVLFDSFRDTKARQDNYNLILRKLERFTFRNRQFYEYWLTGATDLDHQYFIRQRAAHRIIDRDEKFSTGYDLKLGKMLAHEQLRKHILSRIDSSNKSQIGQSGLTWTAQKSSLIELIYALHAAKVFNNGEADIKIIATVIEHTFSTALGNYYRTFQDIRIRKANPTIFLDELKTKLTKRIAESED